MQLPSINESLLNTPKRHEPPCTKPCLVDSAALTGVTASACLAAASAPHCWGVGFGAAAAGFVTITALRCKFGNGSNADQDRRIRQSAEIVLQPPTAVAPESINNMPT